MFGVNEYEFLLSVCGNANYIEFQVSWEENVFFSPWDAFSFLGLLQNVSFPKLGSFSSVVVKCQEWSIFLLLQRWKIYD
jgi:hypothetical protein